MAFWLEQSARPRARDTRLSHPAQTTQIASSNGTPRGKMNSTCDAAIALPNCAERVYARPPQLIENGKDIRRDFVARKRPFPDTCVPARTVVLHCEVVQRAAGRRSGIREVPLVLTLCTQVRRVEDVTASKRGNGRQETNQHRNPTLRDSHVASVLAATRPICVTLKTAQPLG
jgi:hypothetical protein